MEKIEFLDSPQLPTDRIGKWGAYVSTEFGGIIRSIAGDFNSEAEAKAAIPMMRDMANKEIAKALSLRF